ncbi:D-alanyl-D-alanine carboxypeptidase family protein [Lysobacter korlensis]|uniref:D-alanyl-D-alanine carboxypeptidase family protein n=1 Tax=Lysobacter korlensis TaxID=553636 RepID=A0ABV6RY71_9GAMM
MPLTRQQIYHRRRIVVFGSLALLLAVLIYLPLTLLAPLERAAAKLTPFSVAPPVAVELTWPRSGGAAIGLLGDDVLLARTGSEEPLPIASITKIVTALTVLDAHPLAEGEPGPDITFDQDDIAIYNEYVAQNGKVVWVSSGTTFSQLDTLKIVLIESANNYAESLVTWAFGSEAEYLKAAQAFLTEHGLSGTTIVDSTGMSPQNTSTTADLVELGRLALQSPVLAQLVSTSETDLPGLGTIDNTNILLGVDGVDGIKTGTLDEAGACLLFSTDFTIADETVSLVGVSLGARNHDELAADVRGLLASVEANFADVQLATAGQVVGELTTEWGETAQIVVAEDYREVMWSETPVTALVTTRDVTTGSAGEEVGVLSVTVGKKTAEVPLELATSVGDPGPWWRLTNPVPLLF